MDKGALSPVKILYDEMSWPELKEASNDKRVPLIRVGSTEQHGPQLLTKTDAFLAYEVCKATAARIPEEAIVMPPVSYGYNEHHLDFPATVHIDYETLIKLVINVGKSLAHHGFQRMIIVNGHGSNTASMEIAARRITLETPAICASLTYLSLNQRSSHCWRANPDMQGSWKPLSCSTLIQNSSTRVRPDGTGIL